MTSWGDVSRAEISTYIWKMAKEWEYGFDSARRRNIQVAIKKIVGENTKKKWDHLPHRTTENPWHSGASYQKRQEGISGQTTMHGAKPTHNLIRIFHHSPTPCNQPTTPSLHYSLLTLCTQTRGFFSGEIHPKSQWSPHCMLEEEGRHEYKWGD